VKYRRLGQTGLFMSELGLGTMTFGSAASGNNSVYQGMGAQGVPEASRLVATALEKGINYFDTADIYRDGESEQVLGASLKAVGVPRDDVIIGTKCFGLMGSADALERPRVNDSGLSRRHIIKSLEASLRRLGTDYIDLYQAHGFDPVTPLEETLRTYDDLIASGKVRYIGCSNWPAWAVAEANGVSDRRGFEHLVSVQAYYSLVGRSVERELVPMMKRQGLGMIVWSPLAGGYLSGKYSGNDSGRKGRRAYFNSPPVDLDRGEKIIESLQPMAHRRGISVARVALAWVLHQDIASSVILGARLPEQLEENTGATDVTLSAEDLAVLDEVSALAPEYPGWQIRYQQHRHLSWRHGLPPNSDVSIQSRN
jgi:aryl-alcohol dehydrogenase-like predicted oxidoreductase